MKLSEVTEILDSRRIPVSSVERAKLAKHYPYYGAQGIVDYIDDYLFDGEYILVAEDGNNLKSLSEPIVTWATGKFWVNNHAHILGPTRSANLRYIYYRLMVSNLTGLITGSAQPKLNQANLANLEFQLPDIRTQDAVASLLSAIDDKIANNKKLMGELEATARLIYDYWFTQFDFPDENGKSYRSSGGTMVYNPTLKRDIPATWEVATLGDVCSFKNGVNYDKSNMIGKPCRIVNVRDISSSTLFINQASLDEIELPETLVENYMIREGDILIARSGTPGAVRLVSKPEDTVFSGFIICCSPNKNYSNTI